jgi:diacylglycerol O-acyltransferase
MERLSGFDAWLLYGETPTVHMHTLKIAVVDASERPFSIERFRRTVGRRLHLLPLLRYLLVEVPYGLHHPMWLENSEVDLEYHIRPVSVPAPGGRRELDQVIGTITSTPLDRSRPLWEIHVAEGLEGGRVALVTKIHHALADGLASANLLARAVEHHSDEVLAEREMTRPDPVPTTGQVLRQAALDHGSQLRALPGLIGRTAAGVRRLRADPPPRPPTSAKVLRPVRTFLNRAISGQRSFATVSLPLPEAKAVSKSLGITLNDTILGLAAGTMRELLLRVEGRADDPLVASVPTSTDTSAERISGNKIGAMLVSLPTQLTDPVERCQAASQAAQVAKEQNRLLGPELMQEWLAYVPPKPFERYSRYVSRRGRADRAAVRMNVVVSNVPGPREQVFVSGLPLSEFYSVGPLWEGCGLNITIWSYVDQLNMSVLADREILPEPHLVTEAFCRAFDELRHAVGLPGATPASADALPPAPVGPDSPV